MKEAASIALACVLYPLTVVCALGFVAIAKLGNAMERAVWRFNK